MKNDEFFWEVSDYSWSPDGKWIAYSFVEFNRNNKVFLYSLEQNKSVPLTDGFYDSMNPSFDANGEYLYFLSYRDFTARIDIFEDNHVIPDPVQVMAVQLKAGQKPPFDKARRDKKAEAGPFRIDLAGIEKRVFPLPVQSGNYFYLKAGKGIVTWASTRLLRRERDTRRCSRRPARTSGRCTSSTWRRRSSTTLDGTISDWKLSPNREQMIARKGNVYTRQRRSTSWPAAKTLGRRSSTSTR